MIMMMMIMMMTHYWLVDDSTRTLWWSHPGWPQRGFPSLWSLLTHPLWWWVNTQRSPVKQHLNNALLQLQLRSSNHNNRFMLLLLLLFSALLSYSLDCCPGGVYITVYIMSPNHQVSRDTLFAAAAQSRKSKPFDFLHRSWVSPLLSVCYSLGHNCHHSWVNGFVKLFILLAYGNGPVPLGGEALRQRLTRFVEFPRRFVIKANRHYMTWLHKVQGSRPSAGVCVKLSQ